MRPGVLVSKEGVLKNRVPLGESQTVEAWQHVGGLAPDICGSFMALFAMDIEGTSRGEDTVTFNVTNLSELRVHFVYMRDALSRVESEVAHVTFSRAVFIGPKRRGPRADLQLTAQL